MLKTGKKGLKLLALCSLACVVLAGAVILAGCYPGEISSVDELDLVVTLRDKDTDFSALTTYWMPDTVIHICEIQVEEQEASCPNELDRRFDAQILSEVRENLQDMGFTEVADSSQADVFVVVAANATDNYGGYTYYPWYWGGYPGWGWYYPPTTVVYEFTTGALLINMFDPNKADVANKRFGAVWVAAINGVLGEGGNPQSRINTTINQAFRQSPYLGAGK